MKVKFTVPGNPLGKERSRSTIGWKIGKDGKKTPFIREYTPDKTRKYETQVGYSYKQQCRGVFFKDGVPLDMRITAYFKPPKTLGKKYVTKKMREMMLDHKIRPTAKPDASNVQKAIEDGLNHVAYEDDSQIVDCQFRKFYSEDPRVVVTIQEADAF